MGEQGKPAGAGLTGSRQRLRVGVVGAGRISSIHLRYLASAPNVDLVAVADRTRLLGRLAADRFAIPAVFDSHVDMIEKADLDAVHVLTPAITHEQIAKDFLETGTHTLVEKPIALSRQGFRELWELAQRNDAILTEDQNYRLNSVNLQLLDVVKSGAIGDVCDVDVVWHVPISGSGSPFVDPNLPHASRSLPAGAVHEFITHLVYLALQFVPSGHVELVGVRWSDRPIPSLPDELVDGVDALFAAGGVGVRLRFNGYTNRLSFTVEVRGTDGRAVADLYRPSLTLDSASHGGRLYPLTSRINHATVELVDVAREVKRRLSGWSAYEGVPRFIGAWHQGVLGTARPPIGFDEMNGTLALIDTLVEGRGGR